MYLEKQSMWRGPNFISIKADYITDETNRRTWKFIELVCR